SHQMVSVEAFCPRSVVLQDGQLVFDGPTDEAAELYLSGANAAVEEGVGVFDVEHVPRPAPAAAPMLRRGELRGGQGRLTDSVPMGAGLSIAVDVEGLEVPRHHVVVNLVNETDVTVLHFTSLMKPPDVFDSDAEQDRVVLTFPTLPFTPGHYSVD